MDENQIREHARRLIEMHNEEFEYCLVYEDEELEDASEDDWRAIHSAMYSADIAVTWPLEMEN